MALQCWCPLVGDSRNQGLCGPLTNNSVTFDSGGKLGNLCMSGGSIVIPASKAATIFSKNTFTYSFWYKPIAESGSSLMFGSKGNGSGRVFATFIYSSPIRFHGDWRVSSSGSVINWHYLLFTLNQWQHVTVVYDGSSATVSERNVKIYLNGVLNLTYYGNCNRSDYNLDMKLVQGSSAWRVLDVRLYDHSLSPSEVKELSMGKILHIPGNEGWNLAGVGATNTDVANGTIYSSGNGWGGTDGSIQIFQSGGYQGKPYMVYHRTACGSGGFYTKRGAFRLKGNTTYTYSCWIKASHAFTENAYNFTINGVLDDGSDANYYINYGSGIPITTEWKRFTKTFTTASNAAGVYGFMPIIYTTNSNNDLYVYYSGFQIELADSAGPWVFPTTSMVLHDISGLHNDLTSLGSPGLTGDTKRYERAVSLSGASWLTTGSTTACKVAPHITVSAWASRDSWTGNWRIISCTQSGGWTIYPVNDYICWLPYISNSYRQVYSKKTLANISAGWHHFVGTWDGTNAKLYIDGELQNTVTVSGGTLTYNTSNAIFIGAEAAGDTVTPEATYFNGKISDVRIYATALSAADILELYSLGN